MNVIYLQQSHFIQTSQQKIQANKQEKQKINLYQMKKDGLDKLNSIIFSLNNRNQQLIKSLLPEKKYERNSSQPELINQKECISMKNLLESMKNNQKQCGRQKSVNDDRESKSFQGKRFSHHDPANLKSGITIETNPTLIEEEFRFDKKNSLQPAISQQIFQNNYFKILCDQQSKGSKSIANLTSLQNLLRESQESEMLAKQKLISETKKKKKIQEQLNKISSQYNQMLSSYKQFHKANAENKQMQAEMMKNLFSQQIQKSRFHSQHKEFQDQKESPSQKFITQQAFQIKQLKTTIEGLQSQLQLESSKLEKQEKLFQEKIQSLQTIISSKSKDFEVMCNTHSKELKIKNDQILKLNNRIQQFNDNSLYPQQRTENSLAIQTQTNSINYENYSETPTQKFLQFQLQEIAVMINQCFKEPLQQSISYSYESRINEKQARKLFSIIEFIKTQILTLSKEQQDLYYFVQKKKDKQLKSGIFKIPKQIEIVKSKEQSKENSVDYSKTISDLQEKIQILQQQLCEYESKINYLNQQLQANGQFVMTESSDASEREDIVKLKNNLKALKTALRSSFGQRELLTKEIQNYKKSIVEIKVKFHKSIELIKQTIGFDEFSKLKSIILRVQKEQHELTVQGIKDIQFQNDLRIQEIQKAKQRDMQDRTNEILHLKQEIKNFDQLTIQESEKNQIIEELQALVEENQRSTNDLRKNWEKRLSDRENELVDLKKQINKEQLKYQNKYSELSALLESQKGEFLEKEKQFQIKINGHICKEDQLNNQIQLENRLTLESDNQLHTLRINYAHLKNQMEEANRQLFSENKELREDLLNKKIQIENCISKQENLEEKVPHLTFQYSKNSQLQFNITRSNTLHEEEVGQLKLVFSEEKFKSQELQEILQMYEKENEELKLQMENQEKSKQQQLNLMQEELSQQLLDIQQLLHEKQGMEQNLINYAQKEFDQKKRLEELEEQLTRKNKQDDSFQNLNEMQLSIKQLHSSAPLNENSLFDLNCSSILGKKVQDFIDLSDEVNYRDSEQEVPEEIQQLQLTNMLQLQANEELKAELIERENNENKLMKKIQLFSQKIKEKDLQIKEIQCYSHLKLIFSRILQNIAEKYFGFKSLIFRNEAEFKNNFNAICSILSYTLQEKEILTKYTKDISKQSSQGLFKLFK